MLSINEHKKALDRILRIARVHFYKPIQIAEILYRHRTTKGLDLNDIESYRNISKRWRDEISMRLVGRKSTSSQKYQDNVFERNAMPPRLLAALGDEDKRGEGFVEAYIYKSLQKKLESVREAGEYIASSSSGSFSIKKLVSLFAESQGLRRSTDKIYEVSVYALFATIVRALKAQITLEVVNKDRDILKDFEFFIQTVLGIDSENSSLVMPARLYRVGVTNAADRGLDMWANFGAAVQVKHLTLTEELAEDIMENIAADRVVIVCLDAEKNTIETILKQVGWGERVQGIITLNDLNKWYGLCLSEKYREKLGGTLLTDLNREFNVEFPSTAELEPFLKERGYTSIAMPRGWEIK